MTENDFDVSVTRHADATVLNVRGDVDMVTAPVLRSTIEEVARAGPKLLVIDLMAVTFLSSAGLLVLVETAEAGRPEVRVVGTGRECLRPIRLTGLDTVLSLHETLADALR
ncbi:STAS domain-containing protein [Actinophytocola sp. NPDC049390]|uniref:STAS domain-containing protein n=1 Tax=Actinophytocola sp. NPDC049390 TaxID=3363894 RepID=UPI0037A7BEC0